MTTRLRILIRPVAFSVASMLAAITAVSIPLVSASSLKGPVSVAQGRLTGVLVAGGSITAFKGVPFAAPPIGDLRWRAPQPPAAWTGVRIADTFSPACIQTIVQERKPWTFEFMTHGEISEDCLYLNVWTPATAASERRPVFVYIYGGANTEGSASVPVYDGEGLASKGLVVVTINYRVGILGFYSHPDLTKEAPYHASGNYGLLDQIAAVRWVHDNIAAFGGDPTRVTIAGQSAGAQAVHNLVNSPLARGLFQRGIAQSGSTVTTGAARTNAEQDADGVRFASAKGAASLAALRAMPWKDLVAPVAGPASVPGAAAPAPFRWSPVVDGYALPITVRQSYDTGAGADVAMLTGSNADENGAVPRPTVTAQQFASQARQRYGADADAFLALYPAGNDDQARIASNDSARDAARVSTALWAANRARHARSRTYTYFWNHPLPGPDVAQYGAFHTSEVPYVLNTLARSDRPFSAVDHRIADQLSSYWANFARSGNPNGPGLPHWPDVAEAPSKTMQIGDRPGTVGIAGTPEKMAFHKRMLLR